jgi:hypothetical protein
MRVVSGAPSNWRTHLPSFVRASAKSGRALFHYFMSWGTFIQARLGSRLVALFFGEVRSLRARRSIRLSSPGPPPHLGGGPGHRVRGGPTSLRNPAFYLTLLIVVRMTVAPIPVVSLHSVVLSVVRTISPVLCYQVTSVGVVFAVVPVMVITVVPIVDSDLHAGLLSFGFGHN